MKDTANSCMVVATLIATVVFAAVFTLPGGTKEDSGTHYFLREVCFKIFVISDGISLVLSVCSILTFLSILTSRYAEKDFLLVLPTKLMVGLSTLLLSIAAMMVVFCATIFIVFKDGKIWVPILLSVIASVPVIVFVKQKWPLLIDVARLTYNISSRFDNEGNARKRNMLCNKDDNGGCWSHLKERCGYYKSKCHKLS
ncbi:ankyrin repeat-containing protein ITN1-like [Pistacia vera]|uniref:ankyrin repeat-containing protein ITN1-like n=1 Tax=Pistacia vera TaxID=55513 RepID=UPI001262B0BF|nr:ankyrin repeat-containing protein ITN1-like [Pistacia vera]